MCLQRLVGVGLLDKAVDIYLAGEPVHGNHIITTLRLFALGLERAGKINRKCIVFIWDFERLYACKGFSDAFVRVAAQARAVLVSLERYNVSHPLVHQFLTEGN